MFIRQCFRKKDGKRHAYWALVESYRTDSGPRQRVVAWLGKLDESGRLGVEQAVRNSGLSHTSDIGAACDKQQLSLFDHAEEVSIQPEWVEVDVSQVRIENCRQFGGPWLALEVVRSLQLDEFLKGVMPPGRERVAWWRSVLILVVARLCNPSSELHISEQWYPRSSIPELLGVPADRVDDNRLYRTLDRLLPHKAKLEAHLKDRMGELFDLEYDLFLAYVLWKTLGQMCQKARIGNEPRRVLEELSDLRMVDVVLPTRRGIEIRKRCLSKPTDHQQILLDHLKLRLPKIIQKQM